MSTQCKGCGASVKRSGLYPHFQRSRNPLCELYRLQLDEGALLPRGDSLRDASEAIVGSGDEPESETSGVMKAMLERQST
jgi:hypothetical protein